MLEIWRAEPHAEDRVKAAEQLFDHPVDLQATRRFLAEGVNELLIAYADGEPAGFVSATARVASEAAMTVRYAKTLVTPGVNITSSEETLAHADAAAT